ncbi:pyroglutamyl-peptidase I [bacterium]|nr:pyroglutamyl-peptidase I [bacterium]
MTESRTVLVTGFEPFGGQRVNPALRAVSALPETVAGARVVTLRVPVTYEEAVPTVRRAMDAVAPDAIMLVGQAAGRPDVTVERVAINVDDAVAPDNAGTVRCDTPIRADGPAAYFSTLPVRDMLRAMREAGVPASLSNSAGTYVCNHLMYGVLDEIARAGGGAIAGFVHVPLLHEQVIAGGDMRGKPSMSPEDIARALTAAVEAIVRALI